MLTIWRDALWSGRNRHFQNSKTRSVRYAFCAQFLSQQARQDGRAWRAAMITGENPLAAGPSPHGRCAREAPLWRRAAYRAAHRCPIASNNTPERKRRSSGFPNLGLGNAWTRHHHFFAGAGEGDITRPTLHRVAPLDRLRHVVGLVASVLRSFERPISATSVGILRPHFGRQVRRGVGDRRARAGRSDDRSPLEGFCWRTYHQARAARSDDEGGLSGVRRVTLKPRRESPLSIADSRQPG